MLLSSSLSWSKHISCISSKTRKLLGLLYRHFYCHSDTFTPLRLNTSLTSPHLFSFGILSSNLSSCLEKIACKLCCNLDPQTTLLFSLSFIFLYYLLAIAMLNLPFSSSFFILIILQTFHHDKPLPARISDPSTHVTVCKSTTEPNMHSSHFSQPLQGYGTLFPIL